ncbi:MAG: hypothetical protein AB7J28_13195 [Hyphomonadaceae bacterium]
MRVRVRALAFAALVSAAAPAWAETYTIARVQFEAPERFTRDDGPPRPNAPFLRLRNGARTDPMSEFIEAMSGPEAAMSSLFTRETYAAVALGPANVFCMRSQVLRNTTRQVGEAFIVDVGYVCYDHSRQPQFSRQVVRTQAVFLGGAVTTFMFVRVWLDQPHPDDALTPEQWMAQTDSIAASIAPAP